MAYSVLERAVNQCRDALLGGIPILYIKTDSPVFMRDLVCWEKNPLIVLLSKEGRYSAKDLDKDLGWMRPLYERADPRDRRLENCANYKEELPSLDYSGLYKELMNPTPALAGKDRPGPPFLWCYQMPGSPEEQESAFAALEQYVLCHGDPGHPQYPTLQSSVVLLYSSQVALSPALQPYTQVVEVGLPDEEEIRAIIKAEAQGHPALVENDAYLSALCTDLLGFSTEEIVMIMQRVMVLDVLDDTRRTKAIITERKRQKLEGGLLEQVDPGGSIGGMDSFRRWLMEQRDPLENANAYVRRLGVPPPKGVLLCGIPGCGKSEAAKFTAETLRLPLLKMDIGSLMNRYQGVSEQRMRDALKMAEAMSPCVLWIDELEKGFSGAGRDGDSSSFRRMFGYMLGWMQDNRKPCFLFATANDIGGLPKEFFRSGRFDALYAVYLPTAEECAGILRAGMERAIRLSAEARHIRLEEVELFELACLDTAPLRALVNELLVLPGGRPRIVIGADLQKAVQMALRALPRRRIPAGMWLSALRGALGSPSFAAYGDGEENIDSIAVSYCRMLRKSFLPTGDKVLFSSRDYHGENAEGYARLKAASTGTMDAQQLARYQEKLKELEVLRERPASFPDAYDAAVYAFLRERINQTAPALERWERDQMRMR